jgi:hypothetical protein
MRLTSIRSLVGVSVWNLFDRQLAIPPGALAGETNEQSEACLYTAAVARGWAFIRKFRQVLKYIRCNGFK